jgi:ABC-2 type transport system ATP-binding protein
MTATAALDRAANTSPATTEPVLVARGLTKRYGDVLAVDAVDLEVHPGEVYGFLGPNGAGKTTTMRMLLGLIRPTAGTATVLGHRPGSPQALAEVGALVESPGFYPYLSGHDNLRVLARYSGTPSYRIGAVLELVDLAGRAGDRFSTYSLGMKQRLGVAAALLKNPRLLILDEPTNGLDPAGMAEMRELVRRLGEEGRAVLLSSHLLGEVQQVCDRIGIIAGGRIVTESTVSELRGQADLVVVAEPLSQAHQVIAGLVGDGAVAQQGDALRCQVPAQQVAEVNRALVSAGIDVTELRREEKSLEEVFLNLTGSGTTTGSEAANEGGSHVG